MVPWQFGFLEMKVVRFSLAVVGAGGPMGGISQHRGGSPEDSPSLCIISTAVTPGYKFPCSSLIGTMKQWGPKEGTETGP